MWESNPSLRIPFRFNKIRTRSSAYVDLGTNSTGNTNPLFTLFGKGDAYLFNNTGLKNLVIADASTSGSIILGTGGLLSANERMRITSAGNVGIGTTSPWGLLSVAGQPLGTVPLFSISSSTATATTTVFQIDKNGQSTFSLNPILSNLKSALVSTDASGQLGATTIGWPLTFSSQTLNCANCQLTATSTTAGSIIASNFNNSTTAGMRAIDNISGATNPCGPTTIDPIPIAGYLRNVTITTSATQNISGFTHASPNIDCSAQTGNSTQGGAPGGVTIPNNAAAGAFVSGTPSETWRMDQYSQLYFNWTAVGSATMAPVANISSEFVADSGVWTLLASACSNAQNTSTLRFWGAFGACSGLTTATSVAVPMPVAGTLQNYIVCGGATPSANEDSYVMVNSASTTIIATLQSTGGSTQCVTDMTHTAAVSAGDTVAYSIMDAGTSATAVWQSLGFTPSSGSTIIIGGQIGTTITTTANFSMPFTATSSSAIALDELGLPRACSVSKLYVVQVTANAGGVTTTFTLEKNGVDTAITGTITSLSGSGGTGSIAVDTSHTASYAKGDLMTLKYVTGSGTSGSIGAWAAACD